MLHTPTGSEKWQQQSCASSRSIFGCAPGVRPRSRVCPGFPDLASDTASNMPHIRPGVQPLRTVPYTR
eukprot:5058987-Prymnesium_polylepis.1